MRESAYAFTQRTFTVRVLMRLCEPNWWGTSLRQDTQTHEHAHTHAAAPHVTTHAHMDMEQSRAESVGHRFGRTHRRMSTRTRTLLHTSETLYL